MGTVALCALGVRVFDMATGFDALSQPLQAQEIQQAGEAESPRAADQPVGTDTAEAADSVAPDSGTARPSDDASFEPVDRAVTADPYGNLPSAEELELISQLRERRQELEARSEKLDMQAQLLQATEKRIRAKTEALQELNEQIKTHLRLFEERELEQLKAIVRVYEKMKPKEAAPIFEALGMQTQLDIVSLMKPGKIAAILAKMTPSKATNLTAELAQLAEPPTLDEVRGGSGR